MATVEERLSALEEKVAQLLIEKGTATKDIPWCERRYGSFEGDEMYDEAMRLGAEYRRSQPTAADDIEALEKAGLDPTGKLPNDSFEKSDFCV